MEIEVSKFIRVVRNCHIRGRAVAVGDVVEVSTYEAKQLARMRRGEPMKPSRDQLLAAAGKAIGAVLVELGLTAEPGAVEKFVAGAKGGSKCPS